MNPIDFGGAWFKMGNIFIFQWPLTQLSFLKCFLLLLLFVKTILDVGNRSRRK